MIISPARRYIFVHIPKTGGTAFSLALEERAHKDDILIGDTPKAIRRRNRLKGLNAAGRLWKHSTLADIEGVLAPETMDEMMVVALVRNPWDRVVSYYHWLREQSFEHPAVGVAKATDFKEFVRTPEIRDSLRHNSYGSYFRLRGVEKPALFIRLERFSDEIAPFERHLGFRITLPKVNESPRDRDFRRYFDSETKQIVAQECAEDINRFTYSYD